eukprot:365650-Chlamydomonas_euryale.AAC.10
MSESGSYGATESTGWVCCSGVPHLDFDLDQTTGQHLRAQQQAGQVAADEQFWLKPSMREAVGRRHRCGRPAVGGCREPVGSQGLAGSVTRPGASRSMSGERGRQPRLLLLRATTVRDESHQRMHDPGARMS